MLRVEKWFCACIISLVSLFLTSQTLAQSQPHLLGEWYSGNYISLSQVRPTSNTLMIAGIYDTNFVEILDISNPSAVRTLSRLQTKAMVWDIQCEKDLCYAAEMRYGLEILDVHDLTAPKVVGRFIPDSLPLYLRVRDTLAFVGHEFDPLEILSIKDPLHPRRISRTDTGRSYGFTLVGDSVYLPGTPLAQDWCILDIKNPSKPRRVVSAMDTSYSSILRVDGKDIYAARSLSGLSVYHLDAQGKPKRMAETNTSEIQSMELTDKGVFIGGWKGLYRFQYISGRLEQTYQEPDLDVSKVVPAGDRMYVVCPTWPRWTLRTYSLSDQVSILQPMPESRRAKMGEPTFTWGLLWSESPPISIDGRHRPFKATTGYLKVP